MIQQSQTRQPDETLCFRCNNVVKRDIETCPNCGSRIASGPKHTAAAPLQVRGLSSSAAASGEAQAMVEDVVGAGRYILNFVLAGFIGLGLTYLMRRQGWLATWICIPIMILAVIILVNTR